MYIINAILSTLTTLIIATLDPVQGEGAMDSYHTLYLSRLLPGWSHVLA